MGVGVRGILLDSSALLVTDGDDGSVNLSLKPGVDYLFRKLRHSNIPTGILYGHGLPSLKVELLERIVKLYSFDLFVLNSSSIDVTANEVARAWGNNGGSSGAIKESSMLIIDKLEELPLTICNLNRKAVGEDSVMVGYIMKPSREEDFAKRGAFPLRPTQNGLIFMPLTFELPMSTQLQQVDVIFHKATDEIIYIELSSSWKSSNNIIYSEGMLALQRCLEQLEDSCVIDPFDNIYPVLDRLKIQQLLLGLESLNTECRSKIRAPHFLKVDNFNEPDLGQRLLEAKLSPPSIVKPQVACGVADAHTMAIVYNVDDYGGLNVPLPAVVQEYVDHSSSLFKFYVLGDKVFYAVKKSIPNADILIKLSEKDGLKPLLFDSLKSLPTSQEDHKANSQQMDLGLVTDAANWLRKMLNLTIFGFDVVIQEGTGDHVIVDVNYLPSFKEVPDDVAIPAFWEAIKSKYKSSKTKEQV